MDQIVADASVIIKLFVNEEYSEDAYRLRDAYVSKEIELVEPDILTYEVLNGIRYYKSKKFNLEELKMIADALNEYDFKSNLINIHYLNKLMENALKYNISVYDSIYVTAAELNKCILYTADEKLIKAVKEPFVKHIDSFA